MKKKLSIGNSAAERAAFIRDNHGLFEGVNEDGEQVLVGVEKGEGMTVKTIHKSKPRWYECIEYGPEGYQEGISYESVD